MFAPERLKKGLSCFVTGILDLGLGKEGKSTDVFIGWISRETSVGVGGCGDGTNEGIISVYFPVIPFGCYNQCKPLGAMIIMACIWPTVILEGEKVNQDLGNYIQSFHYCLLFILLLGNYNGWKTLI